jgi:transposase
MTLLSSIRFIGTAESVIFEGALNSKMFYEYIKKILFPALHPGDIIIMDKLSVHKPKIVQDTIESLGVEYMFLPAYSPDLNSIEKIFSKIKQIVRGIKARSPSELFSAAGTALGMVTASDAQEWFESCGYVNFQS